MTEAIPNTLSLNNTTIWNEMATESKWFLVIKIYFQLQISNN